jgi:methionyl-tRNA formyltransferase
MLIAFFGLPLAALLLCRDGHDVGLAVLSRPEAVGQRRLRRLLGGARVCQRRDLDDDETRERIERLRPDLVVSWFWTAKLPLHVVSLARLGGIGAHPSLLPRHRGPDPYFAAIDRGDSETGVTIHRIDDSYDTGAVLAQQRLAIDPAWNAWQLARRLDRPSLDLLRDVVNRLARGESVPEVRQDERLATWAPEPDNDTCEIRWSSATEPLVRRIRALCPAPGAFTQIGSEIVTILEARATASYPRALLPGEGAVVGGTAVIRTGDHAVELLAGERDGQPLDRQALATLVESAEKVIG